MPAKAKEAGKRASKMVLENETLNDVAAGVRSQWPTL